MTVSCMCVLPCELLLNPSELLPQYVSARSGAPSRTEYRVGQRKANGRSTAEAPASSAFEAAQRPCQRRAATARHACRTAELLDSARHRHAHGTSTLRKS